MNVWVVTKYICNCRVCELTFMYPEQVERVIEKVFDYMMQDIE